MQITIWTTGTPTVSIPGLLSFELKRTDGKFLLKRVGDDTLVPVPESFSKITLDRVFSPGTIRVGNPVHVELEHSMENNAAIKEFYESFLGDRIETKVDEFQVVEAQRKYRGIVFINSTQFEFTAVAKIPMRGVRMKLASMFKIARKFINQEFAYRLTKHGQNYTITPEIKDLLDSTVGSEIYSIEELVTDRVWGRNLDYNALHSYTVSWFGPSAKWLSALRQLGVRTANWAQYPPPYKYNL